MAITFCHSFCFSPTGGTAKIAEAIAEGTGLSHKLTDVTLRKHREIATVFSPEALVLLAVPVYFGRVERHAAEAISSIQGQGQPAILVVNYGNRHYDDALLELHSLAVNAGFVPIAAGAFVSEHSFSTPESPMAAGRPDQRDLEQAKLFGVEVMRSLAKGVSLLASVPGNTPYKAYPDVHRAPVQHTPCAMCGLCVDQCPVDAISVNGDEINTDEQLCILCQACVKGCPEGARIDSAPGAKETREKLGPYVKNRREPEMFF